MTANSVLPDELWSKWVRCFRPLPAGTPRLVCFPHAGGSAGYFFRLAQLLAPQIEVLAVQYPGRQDRWSEPLVQSIPELAAAVTGALDGRISGRYALFGHSLGAVLAFEVARALEQQPGGHQIRLFASGRRSPCRARQEDVHLRDDPGVLAELRSLEGSEPAWLSEPELVELFLPTIRSDYKAIESYRFVPGRPLRSPITVLTGDRDPRTTMDDARAWEAHSAPGFAVQVFRGGHFFIADHWPAVADLVRGELAVPA